MIGREPSSPTILAVLLGASKWPQWKELEGGKSFANSAKTVGDYLLDPGGLGLTPDNLLDLFDDESNPDTIDKQLAAFLKSRIAKMKQAAHPATDLLIYYVGHGGFEKGSTDYYLAIVNSRPDNRSVSSIRVVSLAKTIKDCARHLRCFLILDCCFSASAGQYFQADPSEIARNKADEAFRKYPNKGSALLSSSAHDAASEAPPDKPYTMFSAALIRALRDGSTELPNRLSLEHVGDLAWDFIEDEYGTAGVRPESTRQRSIKETLRRSLFSRIRPRLYPIRHS